MFFSCNAMVIDLIVRSDFPISRAISFWVADGFFCTMRSRATSSKVQFLHFGGNSSPVFALWTSWFALWDMGLFRCWYASMATAGIRNGANPQWNSRKAWWLKCPKVWNTGTAPPKARGCNTWHTTKTCNLTRLTSGWKRWVRKSMGNWSDGFSKRISGGNLMEHKE